MATVDKIDDCIGHCCGSKSCDVAFMVNKNCYLVKCHNSDSCELKRSENPKFDTMLSVVSKTKGKAIQGKGQYIQHKSPVSFNPSDPSTGPLFDLGKVLRYTCF